jgi:hypothetical protein
MGGNPNSLFKRGPKSQENEVDASSTELAPQPRTGPPQRTGIVRNQKGILVQTLDGREGRIAVPRQVCYPLYTLFGFIEAVEAGSFGRERKRNPVQEALTP